MRSLPFLLSLYLIAGFGLMSTCVVSGDPAPSSKAADNVPATDWFKELEKRYPQHFKLPLKNGQFYVIREDDEIGKFVISCFQRKSKLGSVVLGTRAPENFAPLGQCVIDKENGEIQILLGKRLGDKETNADEFWNVLVFELLNSTRIEQNNDIRMGVLAGSMHRKVGAEQLLKFEYDTAILTHRFYNNTWKPFLIAKHVRDDVSPKPWDFDESFTFKRWLSALETTEDGRNFLKRYRGNSGEK